ncbi:hypothetical protein [Miniimonas arenae]|nr:hypothetical protein [Miniimonas arenae]
MPFAFLLLLALVLVVVVTGVALLGLAFVARLELRPRARRSADPQLS